jgi:uncharacterized protein
MVQGSRQSSSQQQQQKGGRPRHVPERTCVACRATRPKRDLVRLVHLATGAVEVDTTGKKAGRGAYLCAQASCWDLGLKKDRLARALRGRVLPEDQQQLLAYAATLPQTLPAASDSATESRN